MGKSRWESENGLFVVFLTKFPLDMQKIDLMLFLYGLTIGTAVFTFIVVFRCFLDNFQVKLALDISCVVTQWVQMPSVWSEGRQFKESAE